MKNRRNFIKTLGIGAAASAFSGTATSLSAKSYSRVIGANDRLHIAIIGLGRRYEFYAPGIANKDNNVELSYLCDVMQSRRERGAARFEKLLDYKPALENDIRKVLANDKVDAIINSTPDHWHTPGACLAMQAGKHVYLEKPCSHNPAEVALLVASHKKHDKFVQMGNQYRTTPHFQEIIKEIHGGLIGTTYKAIAFYTNSRGEVPVAVKAPVPEGLDWNLFQGPAPRAEYTHPVWDYNWHWYGWTYGTGELGNNAIHELDVARWAMQLECPELVEVDANKQHFLKDGWTMYDTVDATFKFSNKKTIRWDGKSRNGYATYGTSRGTLIYGSEGVVNVCPEGYKVFDCAGKLLREKAREDKVDDGTSRHLANFFNTIRGNAQLASPIEIGAVSNLLINYANIAYRTGKALCIDPATGLTADADALKLWGREYEPGWEPKVWA